MKRSWFIGIIIFVILLILGISFIIYFKEREIPIDNEGFVLNDDLNVEVYEKINISSLIKNIDGTLLEDKTIDTTVLGERKLEFLYKNKKGRKRRGEININIVDTTAPIILIGNSYTVTTGYNKDLTEVVLSADNYDSNPVREIVGEYNYNEVGSYPLTYKVTDQSGNETSVDFILNVKAKSNSSLYQKTYTNFNDVVNNHKNDSTKIGLDVSKWQGDIDFNALKEAGVEYIIIRVGTGLGFGESSIEDVYFKQNIEGAISAGIPVGIYYYSYATSIEEAKEQAAWVTSKLEGYKIDLPIAFDWESWSYFNGLELSIYDINEIANTFLQEVERAGYDGILYSSKYYLENIWKTEYPVWLAHYTTKTNYEGEYDIWQLCDNGKINGINGAVDINVMYK